MAFSVHKKFFEWKYHEDSLHQRRPFADLIIAKSDKRTTCTASLAHWEEDSPLPCSCQWGLRRWPFRRPGFDGSWSPRGDQSPEEWRGLEEICEKPFLFLQGTYPPAQTIGPLLKWGRDQGRRKETWLFLCNCASLFDFRYDLSVRLCCHNCVYFVFLNWVVKRIGGTMAPPKKGKSYNFLAHSSTFEQLKVKFERRERRLVIWERRQRNVIRCDTYHPRMDGHHKAGSKV